VLYGLSDAWRKSTDPLLFLPDSRRIDRRRVGGVEMKARPFHLLLQRYGRCRPNDCIG
jgi:hypothetical protein